MERRRFLRVTAGLGAFGMGSVAGCVDLGSTATVPGEEHPTVDEWLTETAVGGPDRTYEGTLVDARGEAELRVDVGVGGNGGAYAFDPSGAVVSPGTTIRWVWVDDREAHNVVAAPKRQLDESDYEFRSGGPVAGAGTEFVETLEAAGVALYHCQGIVGVTARRAPSGGSRLAVSRRRAPDFGRRRRRGRAVLHMQPHLSHGMKGGIAVSE